MRRRIPALALAMLAVSVGGVQIAEAFPHHEGVNDYAAKVDSAVVVDGGSNYTGKVSARKPCRADRAVEIRRVSDGSLVGKDRTNSRGRWSVPTQVKDSVTIKVKKSTEQVFFDTADGDSVKNDKDDWVLCKKGVAGNSGADLAIAKDFGTITVDDSGHCCVIIWTVTVTNLGPGSAANAFVIDTPSQAPPTQTFFDAEGATCTDQGNGTTRCELGTLAPGQVTHFLIAFASNGFPDCVNDATVASSTPDPNAANNSVHADANRQQCD